MRKLIHLAAALALLTVVLAGARPAAAQGAGLPAELLDKEWLLVEWQRAPGDTSNVDGKGISLQLSADGSLSGSDGCNQMIGSYTSPGAGQLTLTVAGTTRAACPQEVMDLGMVYTQALATVSGYRTPVPGMLELAYSGQGILRFVVSAASSPPVTLPVTGGEASTALVLLAALTLLCAGVRLRGHAIAER